MEETKTLAQAMTGALASLEQSTKDLTSSEVNARKRHFLQVFKRWEAVFKRADKGDVMMEKFMIAEYYKSLGFLTPHGLELLTDTLKKRCTFFPTIKECLDIVNVPSASQDWLNPFINPKPLMFHERGKPKALAAPQRHMGQISHSAPVEPVDADFDDVD